jgi:hypothetical protein
MDGANPATFFFQIVHFEFSRLPMIFRRFQLFIMIDNENPIL